MFAGCGVQAGFCEAESLHRLAAEDVGFDNLIDVGLSDVTVPNCVWVNHDGGTVFALIETAGLIGAHFSFEAALGEFLLEEFLQLRFRERIAASTGMACRALVASDEDMFLELGHQAIAWVRTSSAVPISASQMPSKSTK